MQDATSQKLQCMPSGLKTTTIHCNHMVDTQSKLDLAVITNNYIFFITNNFLITN